MRVQANHLHFRTYTSRNSRHRLSPMAELSESEIIWRHPIGDMLDSARSQFNYLAGQLGFATPSEAMRCISDGGQIF